VRSTDVGGIRTSATNRRPTSSPVRCGSPMWIRGRSPVRSGR
jgi:hypothetical protein